MLFIGVPIFGIFSTIIFAIWTHHRRKMEELRMQGKRLVAEDIRAEFAALRAEIRDLRDTSMQYDLSFDTALQQMERRLHKIEKTSYLESEAATHHNIPLGGR